MALCYQAGAGNWYSRSPPPVFTVLLNSFTTSYATFRTRCHFTDQLSIKLRMGKRNSFDFFSLQIRLSPSLSLYRSECPTYIIFYALNHFFNYCLPSKFAVMNVLGFCLSDEVLILDS